MIFPSLTDLYRSHGDSIKVARPAGSSRMANRCQGADEVARRPARSALARLSLFPRYVHGDNGAGMGTSHQTGWTGLIARLMRVPGTGYIGNLADGATLAIIARVAGTRRNRLASCSNERSFSYGTTKDSRRFRTRYRICLFVNDPAQSFEILFRQRRELASDPEGATARSEIGTIGEI